MILPLISGSETLRDVLLVVVVLREREVGRAGWYGWYRWQTQGGRNLAGEGRRGGEKRSSGGEREDWTGLDTKKTTKENGETAGRR